MQFVLELRERLELPPITTLDLAELRERTRQEAIVAAGDPEPVASVTELLVADGLPARLYVPLGSHGPGPLLLFFHGGGFVFGDLESHDGICRLLCAASGVRVLAVEYRLAPENPYPTGVEDARTALAWAFSHASELGVDGRAVAVGGDSAGGHLAAVISQLAARDGGPAPALQVLLYPPIDRLTPYESLELFRHGFFLTRVEIDFFEAAYMAGRGEDPTDARRHPLVGDLAGLAPAIVVTAGFDPLRDEGEAYAAALEAAGTPVVLRRYESLIHGFASMIGLSSAARAAVVEIAEEVGVRLR
jgi:acetyl esterase